MEVVAAIFIQKGRALITRRPDHKSHGAFWEFPGGKVQAGETHRQGLTRELYEELKVRVDEEEPQYLGVIESEKISLHFFLSALRVPYLPQEHPACTWLSYRELLLKNLCPADQKAISKYRNQLEPLIRSQPYK